MSEFDDDSGQEVRVGGMHNRGKRYDAILTLKVKIGDVCDDFDMSDGDSFEDIVGWVIEDQGVIGLIEPEDIEIVSIQQIEHTEKK